MNVQPPGFGQFMLVLAIALSLAGAAVSGVLLQHHVVARVGGDPLLTSVCEAAETVSCDDVIASRWGRIEWGEGDGKVTIPTAGLGFGFFACLAAWFIVVGRPAGSLRWLHAVPVAAVAVGVVGCAFLAYIMYLRLEKWCPLCAVTHGLALLLLMVTVLMWPRRAAAAASIADSPAKTVLVAILLAAAVVAAARSEYQRRVEKAYAAAYFGRWQDYEKDTWRAYETFMAQKPVEISVTPGVDPILGPVDAPHTIVVFSDFQCPYCKRLSQHLEEQLEAYPGQARIVFKHFPMNKTCNPHISRNLHAGSCSAAVIAEAAFLLKGNEAFWTFHDALFENQTKLLTGSSLEEFAYKTAEQLGVSRQDFLKRIQTFSAWDRIKANVAEGHSLGIRATPIMYLDGRKMNVWGDRHFWRYVFSPETAALPVTQAVVAPSTAPATTPDSSQDESPDDEPGA